MQDHLMTIATLVIGALAIVAGTYGQIVLARLDRWSQAKLAENGITQAAKWQADLKAGLLPGAKAALLDGKSIVRPHESLEWTRKLVGLGVFAGISSGAALAGAVKVASRIESGTIVFVVCDYGWKYLSTGAYTDDLDQAAEHIEKIVYF